MFTRDSVLNNMVLTGVSKMTVFGYFTMDFVTEQLFKKNIIFFKFPTFKDFIMYIVDLISFENFY